jgi:stage V sporulation protein G
VEITEVRVKLVPNTPDRLRAFCSITFDNAFVVRDLKIIEGARGAFVAMPSRKLTEHCARCGGKNAVGSAFCNGCGARLRKTAGSGDGNGREGLYADIAHPITPACREQIEREVLTAYQRELARSREPGYAPPSAGDPLEAAARALS